MQVASADELEAIKADTQNLKKFCRLRANLSWKEWRAGPESRKETLLQVVPLCSISNTCHVQNIYIYTQKVLI